MYFLSLISGFDLSTNKRLRFCLILVCIWFLHPNVTVCSDQHGTSRPSPATAQARAKDSILESQQQQLLAVMQCVQTMTHQMTTLSTAVQATQSIPAAWTPPASAPTHLGPVAAQPASTREIREPCLPPPERYDGSPGECRGFFDAVSADLQLIAYPASRYPSDHTDPIRRWAGGHDGGLVSADQGGEGQTGEGESMPLLWWERTLRLELPGKRGTPTSGARSTSGRIPSWILHP